MNCSMEKNGTTLMVKPYGVLNSTTVPELEPVLASELDSLSELIVDLSELENITSMGLRLLLTLYRHMEKHGAMHVVNAQGSVADVLSMTGFAEVF